MSAKSIKHSSIVYGRVWRSQIGLSDILLFILLFFCLFDTARNYTHLPHAFGYLKDIACYALFLINIKKLNFPKSFGVGFYLWFGCALLITPIGFFYSGYDAVQILIACFKFLEFFLLCIVFYNYKLVFKLQFDLYVNLFVYGCVALCFVNVFGYFVDNPIVSVNLRESRAYQGRITVGQPPIAILPVIISLCYLLIFKNRKRDKVLMIIFLICILISTSNTGIVAVAVTFLVTAIYAVVEGGRIIRSNLLFIVISIFLLALVLMIFGAANEGIRQLWSVYYSKIGQFVSGGNDPSMQVRNEQWIKGLSRLDLTSWIIGMGAYGYLDTLARMNIENTYILTLLTYGVVGLIGMLAFYLKTLLVCIGSLKRKAKNYKITNEAIFVLCLILITLIHMLTLDIYFVFMLYCPLAMFLGSFIYAHDRAGGARADLLIPKGVLVGQQ